MLAGVVGGLVLLLGGAVGLALYFAKREAPRSEQAAADPKKDDRPSGERTESPTRKPDGPKEEIVRGGDGPEKKEPQKEPEKDPKRDTTPVTDDPSKTRSTLSPEEQERVNKAIEKGVGYLKSHQGPQGTWLPQNHPIGMAALPALTLLECGVPENDPAIQKAAAFVREGAPRTLNTYEIALSVLFLDRLGDPKDEALIRTLGLRLVAGQMPSGGWSYNCPVIDTKVVEPNLLIVLEQTRPRNPLELFVTGNDGKANLEMIGFDQKIRVPPELIEATTRLDPDAPFRGVSDGVSKLRPDSAPPGPVLTEKEKQKEKENTDAARKALDKLPPNLKNIPSLRPPSQMKEMPKNDNSDNSNTQFAILGVLAATRHGVPTDRAMGLIVQRFRTSQNNDGGYGYHYRRGGGEGGAPAMTGAGLLGLAVTHGLTAGMKLEGMAAKGVQDRDIQKSLTALSRNIEKPFGKGPGPKSRGPVNFYFLWTVERVGMLYGLSKINDKDWYHWGAEVLVEAQQKEGNWAGGNYPGAMPMADSCFALLFLKRANLAKDLTVKLQSKLQLLEAEK
jgi:hypothetical protein